jgi:hypothetical protein
MSRATTRDPQVLDWLKAEKQGYEALLALLDQEWECLKRRDISGLIPLTRAKEGRILELHELEQRIRQGLPSERGNPMDGTPVRTRDSWEASLANFKSPSEK